MLHFAVHFKSPFLPFVALPYQHPPSANAAFLIYPLQQKVKPQKSYATPVLLIIKYLTVFNNKGISPSRKENRFCNNISWQNPLSIRFPFSLFTVAQFLSHLINRILASCVSLQEAVLILINLLFCCLELYFKNS